FLGVVIVIVGGVVSLKRVAKSRLVLLNAWTKITSVWPGLAAATWTDPVTTPPAPVPLSLITAGADQGLPAGLRRASSVAEPLCDESTYTSVAVPRPSAPSWGRLKLSVLFDGETCAPEAQPEQGVYCAA